MADYDWDAIRAEYIAGGITYTALAEKYGVSYARLTQRGREEDWNKDKEKTHKKMLTKASTIIAERKARSVANLMTAADKLAERVISDVDVLDGARDVSDLAKALKYAADTINQLYGIQTPAQLHRQKMDEERLALDKRRLEMDIKRQEQDANPPPVRIVIEQPEGDELDG